MDGRPMNDFFAGTGGERDLFLLKKEASRDFVILNLTDIHFSDTGERFDLIPKTSEKIRLLVAKTHPDLITVTGDIVCGDKTRKAVGIFTELMDGFGIPWAPVFGNHDDEGDCTLSELSDVMMKGKHCLFGKNKPSMGCGNYVVCIAEDTADGEPRLIEALFMTDSHHSSPNAEQIAEFERIVGEINRLSGNSAELSLMMHVPVPEFQLAYDGRKDAEVSDFRGKRGEEICCEKNAEGKACPGKLFEAAQRCGTVRHIICGHDHLNDFSAVYKGIRLTYTLKLGPASGYSPKFDGGTEIHIGDSGIKRIIHKRIAFGRTKTLLDISPV